MKIAAIPLTVILLITAALFVTHDDSAASLKEDKAAPIRLLNHKQNVSPEVAQLKEKKARVATMEATGYNNEWSEVPPPIPEEKTKEDSTDTFDGFMCNPTTEAEYPGGDKAWQQLPARLHYKMPLNH